MKETLADWTGDELLKEMARRQEAVINAEPEEARAKARLEAVQGAAMDRLKREGHSVETAKKLMWDDELVLSAHETYLEAQSTLKSAEAESKRWLKATDLWQTMKADLRGRV